MSNKCKLCDVIGSVEPRSFLIINGGDFALSFFLRKRRERERNTAAKRTDERTERRHLSDLVRSMTLVLRSRSTFHFSCKIWDGGFRPPRGGREGEQEKATLRHQSDAMRPRNCASGRRCQNQQGKKKAGKLSRRHRSTKSLHKWRLD